MRTLPLLISLLGLATGCITPNKTFKGFNGSYYTLYPIAMDISSKKDLAVLHGTMYDATSKEILIMASIKAVSDTIFETKTDFDGKYTLKLPEGSYNIIFSYLGYYSTITHDIKVYEYYTQQIDVFMNYPNLETE